ncbi:MAG TPA: hypothetical protein VF650_04350 [Allosphingosinicella sp.]
MAIDTTTLVQELVNNLERACPRIGVGNLAATVSIVETETRRQIAKAAQQICFPSHRGPIERVVDFEGMAYEIRVAEPPENPSRLGVAIVPRVFGSSPARLFHKEIKTRSSLRTQALTVHLPSQLLEHQEEIASITSDMIGVASTWFECRLRSSLKVAEADVIASLYTYFRSQLPAGLQSMPIWFSAASRKRGYYVLDPNLAEAALHDLVGAAPSLSSGPAACLADFLSAAVPIDEAFGLEVARAGMCLDIDFRDAKYKKNLTALQLSEMAVFGGNAASAFPIYSRGDTYLIAAFPTQLRDILLPILELSKDELAQRFITARSRIDRVFKKLVNHGSRLSPADLGEFTGTLLGSLVSTLAKPS